MEEYTRMELNILSEGEIIQLFLDNGWNWTFADFWKAMSQMDKSELITEYLKLQNKPKRTEQLINFYSSL